MSSLPSEEVSRLDLVGINPRAAILQQMHQIQRSPLCAESDWVQPTTWSQLQVVAPHSGKIEESLKRGIYFNCTITRTPPVISWCTSRKASILDHSRDKQPFGIFPRRSWHQPINVSPYCDCAASEPFCEQSHSSKALFKILAEAEQRAVTSRKPIW